MKSVTVRRMNQADISAVLEIQANSKEAAQWSQGAYLEFLSANAHAVASVAENVGCVAGFLVARQIGSEMEILNLTVAPSARREGIGTALLRYVVSQAGANGATKIFLEVRASNLGAQSFYRAHGFQPAGSRHNYYRDPVEDALLLSAAVSRVLQQQQTCKRA